ncbi:methyltransferase domain-containing protein [Nonomuraea endophytica]|uniref:SAM-dependent methyltransferase n=1 Tax=Nonomuraea endophytica TaxID=714136 RepID=A0A7W8EG48_9ACTN|nr:methyltransferase domain-containing protein [Nonomuraea endophytica]MBB5078204.1 SAM-dependent methyltransferase [Nonomuraea endophytica]
MLRTQPSALIPYWLFSIPWLLWTVVALGAGGCWFFLWLGGVEVWPWTLLFAVTMGLCACIAGVRSYSWKNPRLSLRKQPRLAAVVKDAARTAGFRRMPQIRISAFVWTGVARNWHGKPRLRIGLPLLLQLPENELRALLITELTRLKNGTFRTHLLVDLYADELLKPTPWQAEIVAAVREIRRADWLAGAELAGQEPVATFLRRFLVSVWAFDWLMARAPGTPADAYEAFVWKLRHDRLAERIAPNVWDWMRAHPAAAEDKAMDDLGWSDGPVPEPAGDPVVAEVPQRFVTRLLRGVDLETGGGFRLADVTREQWIDYWDELRSNVIVATAEVIGREARDDDVIALVREGRAAEIQWWHTRWPCPHPNRDVCALLPILQVKAWKLGYVAKHPYRQRELVGPDGHLIDVVELARDGGHMRDPDEDARRLAAESLAGGDATGWFEKLYAEAASGEAIVPWDSGTPHPLLVEWSQGSSGDGRRAMVVGCGLGDDAEYLAGLGYATTAFDVSESAVKGARTRFPDSAVDYSAADLLDLPGEWRGAFDLVVEIMTVQALPEDLHPAAIAAVRELVAPGGTLLVIASARDEGGPVYAPPWPLTPSEVAAFGEGGFTADIEEIGDGERRRWRAAFHRP